MSEEEEEQGSGGEEEHGEAARVPMLQAERVRARPRHSLPGRLARAARAALQSHFPVKVPAAASRIPLEPECAAGLFCSGALETHIARALGNAVGLGGFARQESLQVFSAVKKSLPGAATHAVGSSKDQGLRPLHLSGKLPLGRTSVCETMIQGTDVSLLELQLRMVHTILLNHPQSDQAQPKAAGRIALVLGTDFQTRHRVTVESTFGNEEDKHSLSTALSSDLCSRLSWGLSSSLNVNEKLVIFSRYNNDAHAGQRVIFQAVSKVDERNAISPICAKTLGSVTQCGLSWTRSFSQNVMSEECIQVKALCSSNGSFMINVKAQLGEVES